MRKARTASVLTLCLHLAALVVASGCDEPAISPPTTPPSQENPPPVQDPGTVKGAPDPWPLELLPPAPDLGEKGTLSLMVGAGADVAKVKIEIKQVACGSEQLDAAYYEEIVVDVAGADHAVNDELVIVPTGCYDVIALPLQQDGSPSLLCAPLGEEKVVVFDGNTTEVGLVGQCNGAEAGGLDVFVLFNAPPVVVQVEHSPDKFVSYCSSQQICAKFFDPDGDKVVLEWSQVSGIPLAMAPTVVPGSYEYDPVEGTSRECVTIQHGGPGTVGLEVKAYDLMKDADGNLMKVEDVLKQIGSEVSSSDSLIFPSHGVATANCPCVPGAFPEQCDIVDNDCDGEINEGVVPACVCNPFEAKTCYSGPPGTEGVGECRVGGQMCALDGSGFQAACVGEVLPTAEQCDGRDNDCDGEIDEDFPQICPKTCAPGTIETCAYAGPAGTLNVGECKAGKRTCNAMGDGWSACVGQVLPSAEVCDGKDNDCNQAVDDAGACGGGVGGMGSGGQSGQGGMGSGGQGGGGQGGSVPCNPPPAGSILGQPWCQGYDLYETLADGNCGSYDVLSQSCSPDCSPPPAGTVLGQACNGLDLVITYANGSCGSYDVISQCSMQCGPPPPAGTILGQGCQGYDLYQAVADGSCGFNNVLSQVCSAQCNPPPAGTNLGQVCNGFDLVITYANGSCGTYNAVQPSSPLCGYVPVVQPVIDCVAIDGGGSYYTTQLRSDLNTYFAMLPVDPAGANSFYNTTIWPQGSQPPTGGQGPWTFSFSGAAPAGSILTAKCTEEVNPANGNIDLPEERANTTMTVAGLAAYTTGIPAPLYGNVMASSSWLLHCTYAVTNGNGVTGSACTVSIGWLMTPLVLDLDEAGERSTSLDLRGKAESPVAFDFAANGKKALASGWIGPKAGLLAMDLDGNGVIDDGRELFGEATRLPTGERARDGYEALAQHDANHDGVIDAKDPVFASLVVWIDPRQDGKGELRSLSSLGITALGVSPAAVSPEESAALLAGDPGAAQNSVLLKARYFGPERCGAAGCASYDVRFAMDMGEAGVSAAAAGAPAHPCDAALASCL